MKFSIQQGKIIIRWALNFSSPDGVESSQAFVGITF